MYLPQCSTVHHNTVQELSDAIVLTLISRTKVLAVCRTTIELTSVFVVFNVNSARATQWSVFVTSYHDSRFTAIHPVTVRTAGSEAQTTELYVSVTIMQHCVSNRQHLEHRFLAMYTSILAMHCFTRRVLLSSRRHFSKISKTKIFPPSPQTLPNLCIAWIESDQNNDYNHKGTRDCGFTVSKTRLPPWPMQFKGEATSSSCYF